MCLVQHYRRVLTCMFLHFRSPQAPLSHFGSAVVTSSPFASITTSQRQFVHPSSTEVGMCEHSADKGESLRFSQSGSMDTLCNAAPVISLNGSSISASAFFPYNPATIHRSTSIPDATHRGKLCGNVTADESVRAIPRDPMLPPSTDPSRSQFSNSNLLQFPSIKSHPMLLSVEGHPLPILQQEEYSQPTCLQPRGFSLSDVAESTSFPSTILSLPNAPKLCPLAEQKCLSALPHPSDSAFLTQGIPSLRNSTRKEALIGGSSVGRSEDCSESTSISPRSYHDG
jgi:hypothetical protein